MGVWVCLQNAVVTAANSHINNYYKNIISLQPVGPLSSVGPWASAPWSPCINAPLVLVLVKWVSCVSQERCGISPPMSLWRWSSSTTACRRWPTRSFSLTRVWEETRTTRPDPETPSGTRSSRTLQDAWGSFSLNALQPPNRLKSSSLTLLLNSHTLIFFSTKTILYLINNFSLKV